MTGAPMTTTEQSAPGIVSVRSSADMIPGRVHVESAGLTVAEARSSRGCCVSCGTWIGGSNARWQIVIIVRPAGPHAEDDAARYRTPHRVCAMHAFDIDLPSLAVVCRSAEMRALQDAALEDHGWPAVTLTVDATLERRAS